MNRIGRSRLTCLAIVLLISFPLSACMDCTLCGYWCLLECLPQIEEWPTFYETCFTPCQREWCFHCNPDEILQGTADECSATFDQMQLAAIQFCEEYPEGVSASLRLLG